MKNNIFLLFIFSLLLSANPLSTDTFPKSTSLDGRWQYEVQYLRHTSNYVYTFTGDEKHVILPQNWYKHGENHAGVIWYQRKIQMDNLPQAPKHYLEFTGVDYLCDIWINNQYVGGHEGYFQTFDFDMTPYLHAGENSIKVKVNSPLENYPEHYSLHKTLLRGIFSHHDTRPGGAWSAEGQDKNSGGIWNHIAIKSYKNYQLKKLKVTPTITKKHVDLKLSFDVHQLDKNAKRASSVYKCNRVANKITMHLTPSNFDGKSFSKVIPYNKEGNITFSMALEDAKLWYTHDRGFPHLYTLSIQLGETEVHKQIGFKSLIQDTKKTYVLNGTALYLKGTNYISSQYMSEMSTEKLRADLNLMKKAHINTIRVHAHIEPERFYTLCDEMGFLVWQDYNLQWGYIDNKSFQNEAIKQAKEMVDMLYNHPSIYLWSMHNEPPWNSDWMQWKYSDYDDGINKELDDVLYQNIQRYDTHHISKKISSNLEHPWFGWYSGKYQDFNQPSKVPVVSEYGAQAIPKMSSLKKFIPTKYLHPKSKKAKKHWEYHNFQFNWNEKNGIAFKGSTYDFIKDSQTYQANLIKFATEMLRLQKYDGTTAIFQFMFNEGWPSMNWGIVDYYRNTKPGYEALQKAFAPIIAVTKQTPDNHLEFYVINDTLESIGDALLLVDVKTKERVYRHASRVNIGPDSVTLIKRISLETNASVEMHLEYEGKQVKNQYEFSLLTPKKPKAK